MKKLLILLVLPLLFAGCALREASPGLTEKGGARQSATDPNWSADGWDKPTMETWEYIPG